MFRRLVAAAVTLAVLVTASTALAAQLRGGAYRGTNAQKQPVSFTVAGTKVTGFTYKVRPTCRALGQTLPDSGDAPTVTLKPFAVKNGRFVVHQVSTDPGSGGVQTTDVVGTVRGGVVTGTTQDRVTASTQGVDVTCSTPKVAFTARHA